MTTPESHTRPEATLKQLLWAQCVGIAASVCVFIFGMLITIVIGRLSAPKLPPNATEAYETIGGLGEAMLCLFIGGGLSLIVAAVVGILTAIRVADQLA